MTIRDDILADRPELVPFMARHDLLCAIVKRLPEDYDPWGANIRWRDANKAYPDCSGGCKWFLEVDGEHGADWGVCMNPDSHRVGLLTFEHQGCHKFEDDGSDDE